MTLIGTGIVACSLFVATIDEWRNSGFGAGLCYVVAAVGVIWLGWRWLKLVGAITSAARLLRQDNPSHYNRTEWLLIHDYCQKEANVERDAGSTNNWSYNSAVFIDRCQEAIEKVRQNSGQSTAVHAVTAKSHFRPFKGVA